MDYEWAEQELRKFIGMTERNRAPAFQTYTSADIDAQAYVAARIAFNIFPNAKMTMNAYTVRPYAIQALTHISRRAELRKGLGETGPSLTAQSMQVDVWDAAKSLFRSKHYREAVLAAARAVNAQLQEKTGRRDEGETKLIGQSFSLKPATPSEPRLRLREDDGSDTFANMHEGAAQFGRGCFMALRNVMSHDHGEVREISEREALEYLAAFSVLARWIDQAVLQRHSQE